MALESEEVVTGAIGRRPEPTTIPPVDPGRRMDALAPLIHQLITWDLVYRTESGVFVLHDDVQRRLQELSASQPHAAHVYVGRMCQRCGVVGITRLVGDELLCASCTRPDIAETAPEEPEVSHHRRRWHRRAG